jgi:alkanesulfonate monooxygenase SsuD/methylene tetrahydromethanopterin reductase-like flavin-dependent oxidoreductase (luciferase family)
MKEYVEIIKGLLSGHDFSYKGNFFDFHNFPKLVDKETRHSNSFWLLWRQNAEVGW